MNAFRKVLIAILLGFTLPVTASLPPEHEVERLLLLAEQLLSERNVKRAERVLAQVIELTPKPPLRYFYFRGQSLALNAPAQAHEHLTHYVVKGGREAEFYREALALISELDPDENNGEEVGSKPLELSLGNEYQADLAKLKALYLTDDAAAALLQHINALLATHPYTGTRLTRAGEKQGRHYALDIENGALKVRVSEYSAKGASLHIDKIRVVGLDPYLRYGCARKEKACWIYHPSSPTERWLWLANKDAIAAELATSLSRLLVLIQRS